MANDDNWWTGKRGQALLQRLYRLEEGYQRLLVDNGIGPFPKLVSIQVTQEMLGGISRATIYRWVADGELDAIRIRGRRMILLPSILRLLKRCGLEPE